MIIIESTVAGLVNEAERLIKSKSKAYVKLCVIGLCLDVELFTRKNKESFHDIFKKIEDYVEKYKYSILKHGYSKRYKIILQY